MKKIYATYAEQRAARNARQNAKRAQLIVSGLTSKGTPRRRHVRGAGIHYSPSSFVPVMTGPAQSVEDFIALCGRVEVLPGLRYALPSQLPLGEVA